MLNSNLASSIRGAESQQSCIRVQCVTGSLMSLLRANLNV
jgi:hypothetical protein